MKISIPILVLIFLATLLSTAASVAGGLIMYYEGLKSLHDTVVETSKSELDGLSQQMHSPVNAAVQSFEAVLFAMYSPIYINTPNTITWAKKLRQLLFSSARVHPDAVSLILTGAPRNPYSPSALYSGVWTRPLKDGTRSYTYAAYAEHQSALFSVNNATQPPTLSVPVPTYALEPKNGSVYATTGSVDAAPYISQLGQWDRNRDGGWPDVKWVPTTKKTVYSEFLAHKWQEPRVAVTSDGGIYSYATFTALFQPPPPPHPWSAFRMIVGEVELLYAMWQRRVDIFSQGKPDTTVIVYDRKTALVFASTTSDALVNPLCTVEMPVPLPYCIAGIRNMSLTIQEAFHELGRRPYFDLMTKSLDGDEFYALNAPIMGDVEIMWLRPTSTIKGKVQKALTYLIIFSVLVLTFDTLVSVAEIVFIAVPLRKLEFAIDQIGAMRTEAAEEVLTKFDNSAVAVQEMRSVFAGMLSATKQLQEYKAFMPQSVLYSSEESVSEATVTQDTKTGRQTPRSGSGRSRSFSAVAAALYVKLKTDSGKLTRRKRVTLVYCNLTGFNASLESKEQETVGIHTKYVEEILMETKDLHGVIDDLSGDRLSVSFNTVSASTGHEVKGAQLATRVVALPQKNTLGDLETMVAVSAGPALVGNVGCAALKKYSIFGTVPADVRRLLEAGKEWKIRALCNELVAKQAGTTILIRHVAPALVNGRKMLVSEIVSEAGTQAVEEWMYQLEKADAANPHTVNNDIVKHLYSGAVAEAEKLMKDCTCPVVRGLYAAAVMEGGAAPLVIGGATPLPSTPA